ncbi:alpha/beta hydrolase [Flindersiella endophytica]
MFRKKLESLLGDSFELRRQRRAGTWTHQQVAARDEGSPLLVDVVGDLDSQPRKLVFMLPGGGLNFAANYFTPAYRNLAHFLRKQGLCAVGIGPRPGGLARLKQDAHKIISLFSERLDISYDLVGHSAGGALALDYAATYDDGLERLMVIDTTGAFTEPDLRRRAAESLAGAQALLDQGRTTIPIGLGGLIEKAVQDPWGASAVPWPPDRTKAFTNQGAALFALINTGSLPGLTNWIYHGGLIAGRYTFGENPADDTFEIAHSPLHVLHEQARKLDTEAASTELIRDLLAIWSGEESVYQIDWSNIRADVSWVNAELGRGDHRQGAELIRQAGNENVQFTVVDDYGHGDPVWSTTAAEDYWELLSPSGTSSP